MHTHLELFASCLDYGLVFSTVTHYVHGLELKSSNPHFVGENISDTNVTML